MPPPPPNAPGPVARIAEHAGHQAVEDDIRAFLAPHQQADGGYVIENPFRYAMSDRVTASG